MTTKTAKHTLDPIEHQQLERGVVSVSHYANALAPWAQALEALTRRGLMTSKTIWHEQRTVYWVTPAGRDAYVSYGAPYVPITS